MNPAAPGPGPLASVGCSLCGARDYKVRFPATLPGDVAPDDLALYRCSSGGYGLHHPIVQCRRCGFIFASPRREGHTLLDCYEAVSDPLYLEERAGRVLTFRRHLEPLTALTGPPAGRRLLDVGCYTGVFVEIASTAGWDAQGVDPSRWAVDQARQAGLHVEAGTLATAGFPPESFDVITLWDVIEHVDDPAGELRRVYDLLRPGGLAVIHTMDIDSLFARLMGPRWPWLMEMHLSYFSQRTLRRMVSGLGFRVLRSARQGRVVQLSYLVTRVRALFGAAPAAALAALVSALHAEHRAVPIDLGDLFTLYAQKGNTA